MGLGLDVTEETWLTVGQASKIAQRDPRTIRSWADNGIIRARVSPGGHRQIPLSDLLAAQPTQRRSPSATTRAVPPADVIPNWADVAAAWYGPDAVSRMSAAALEDLVLRLRQLQDDLAALESDALNELRHRDTASL